MINNTAINNSQYNYKVVNSANNTLYNNNGSYNSPYGFSFMLSDNNTVQSNIANNNTVGISLVSSNNNLLKITPL
ncbi:MAG: hypothetical protein HeimC3_48020 [Candidatus Heimdallarchaeota archaeon LC_3]|nr:MAG: hypothetical protein HeimC3_48020 [Candidatus Heimdallarchaeota archaeon LC_3]